MRLSDGAVIPGNRKLDDAEREKRQRLYYEPYHRAIDGVIDRCLASGVTPMLLSIHSFTESWKDVTRPWHVGVLWDQDPRLAKPLLESFYAEGDLIVGENEPYAGQLEGDCLWQHGDPARARQRHHRDPPGPDPRRRRPGRLERAALPHRAETLARYGSDAAGWQGGRSRRARPHHTARPSGAQHGGGDMTKIDKTLVTELEAAAFRRLVEHLRTRSDVQNIDLMNLAGFCRNCLSNWYQEAATGKGLELTKDGAREIDLRHALQGVAGQVPEGGERREQGGLRTDETPQPLNARRLSGEYLRQ